MSRQCQRNPAQSVEYIQKHQQKDQIITFSSTKINVKLNDNN